MAFPSNWMKKPDSDCLQVDKILVCLLCCHMAPENPRQFNMFTGEWDDARNSRQKKLDREREQPKQQEMFSPREVLQFGVNPHPPLPMPPGKLELILVDTRTDEEKERDLQRAAEEQTKPMFQEAD